MTKYTSFVLLLLYYSPAINAQTEEGAPNAAALQALVQTKSKALDSLSTQLGVLTKQVNALNGEVTALKQQIRPYPRWSSGLSTTLGFNMSNSKDWLPKKPANLSSATIALASNVFTQLDQKRYYWRNTAAINLGWLKFDNKDVADDESGFQATSDLFNLSSMLGWKITKKIAFSTMTEYKTSLLNDRFNNPGYLDVGSAGLAWTPTPNFRVNFHSLNYNFVFSKDTFDYNSSLGAKMMIDYTQAIAKGVSWKSNFSVFASYQDFSNLSNWAWTNNFSTTIIKGLGVGFDLALRSNKQEAQAFKLTGNPLQVFWVLGLSYNLAKGY